MAAVDKITFGRNLKEAMRSRGLSAAKIARELHVDKSSVSNWCTGKHSPPAEKAYALYQLLNVPTLHMSADQFDKSIQIGAYADHEHIVAIPLADKSLLKSTVLGLAKTARHYVGYASLCKTVPYLGNHRPIELTDREFVSRLNRAEIEFRMVQVFTDETDLANAMRDILRLRAGSFWCHYFPTPATGLPPALTIRSYDGEAFVVAGFYDRPSTEIKHALVFDARAPTAGFFRQHWDAIWNQSIPFPEKDKWNSAEAAKDLGCDRARWPGLVQTVLAEQENPHHLSSRQRKQRKSN